RKIPVSFRVKSFCSLVAFFLTFFANTILAQNPTSITVSGPNNPVCENSSVTFTAIVTGNNPGGTVDFLDGGTAMPGGTNVTGNTGTATFTISNLSPDNHTISANYSGDGSNDPSSTTVNFTLTVIAIPATPA